MSTRNWCCRLSWTLIVLVMTLVEPSQEVSDDTRSSITTHIPTLRKPTYAERLSAPALLNQTFGKLRNDDTQAILLTDAISTIAQAYGDLYSSASSNPSLLEPDIYSWLSLNSSANSREDETPLSDSLLEVLAQLGESGASSMRCVNDSGHVIVSLFGRQKWAWKFLDAAGKIGPGLSEFRVNFVGDYDLCRSLVAPPGKDTDGFRGNYVTLKASLGPPQLANPLESLIVQWGVCMPSTCTDEEVSIFVDEAIHLLGVNGTLYPLQAESHNEQREATVATVAAIILLCILTTLLVLGTLYDVTYIQWPRWQTEWAKEEERRINDGVEGEEKTDLELDEEKPLLGVKKTTPASGAPTGKLSQVLVAFSIYTNGSKALSTSQGPGTIRCLNGIRFLSLTWVILGHMFATFLATTENVVTEVPKLLGRWTFDAVANAFLSVDTFFTMSGFLVSYLTIKEMKRSSWKINWGLFYFHRFWRLTPPYMLAMVLVVGLQQYTGQGPFWSKVEPSDKQFCEDNWWTNLLYINNLVHRDKMCWVHTWYLANDMQFFLVAPLMIIPFYFNALYGFASCGLFMLTTWITTGALSTHYSWPATLVSQKAAGMLSTYFLDYYIAPWCRISPYIVGILAGYILASRPRVRLNWPVAVIGWMVATAVALASLYGLRGDIGGKHPNTQGVASFYNAVARSAWGASVCWVIVACQAGWGGFVNTLLSWSPFVILGRLTYMAYLIHITIITIYFNNMRTLFYLTDLNVAVTFMGILVASYGFAFVFMLALESPMIGLEKVFLPKRR